MTTYVCGRPSLTWHVTFQIKALEFHYREILKILGEDVESEHLWKTPSRAAKAIIFLTSGNQEKPNDLVNGAIYTNSNGE